MATDAGNSSPTPRSRCRSFPSVLLLLLNISLLALAAAALGPVLLLRPRPTPLGWALVSVHAATLLSALLCLYAQRTRRCLPAHAALATAALCGHALALCALLLHRGRCLALLRSARDRREQFVLVLLEEAMLLGMLLVQAVALGAACAVSQRCAREHQAAETEKAAARRGEKADDACAGGGRRDYVRAVDEKVATRSDGAGGKSARRG